MLAAPLKLAKDLNWEKPLQEFIRANYGGETVVREYANDVQRLNNARKRVAQTTVPDEDSIESAKNYLAQLRTVATRFPTLKGGEGKTEWRNLSFSWTDAFRPKSTVSQTDIVFEQACVMFNLGALESLAGIKHDMKTAEGLKQACQNFSRAAGYFACLERAMQPEGTPPQRLPGTLTSDLSPEGLGMLKTLMLAQAQYCCLETALLNELKPGALAKVGAQVTKYYDQALAYARNPVLSKVLDPAWANHMEFHKRKNDSVCAFYYAQSLLDKAKKSGSGYGEHVAWLTKAEAMLRSAWEWASKKGLPSGLVNPLKTLLDKVQGDLVTAIADNNQIYFEQVPDVSSLPAIEGSSMVKPSNLEDRLVKHVNSEEALFKNLFVPWLREAQESFRERVNGLVKSYGEKVTTRTNEVRQGLADAGLPAAVESGAQSESGIPDSLWKKITDMVHAKGGVPGLQADASENKRSNEFLAQKLRELDLDLNTERDADAATRAQYGSAFAAQSSQNLTQIMIADLNRYKSLLTQAKASDDAVPEQLRIHASLMNLLSQSREELSAAIPNATETIESDPRVEKVRSELMMLLVDLGVTVQECETAQTALVEATSDASIVFELEKCDKSKANEIIQKALDTFQPFLHEIDTKLSSMNAKFSAVLEKNHAFAQLRTQNEATRKREKAIAALHTAVQKYAEISGLTREGTRFYGDLAAQIEQLRVEIQDFCFVRNVERDEFIQSRGRPAAAQSFADAPAAPVMATPVPMGVPVAQRPLGSSSNAHIAVPVATRPAPAPPVASAGAPGFNPVYRQTVQQLRDTLGLYQTPDEVLMPYVVAANGDLNLAMDNYFANPPQTPPPAAPAATGRRTSTTSRGGWFQ